VKLGRKTPKGKRRSEERLRSARLRSARRRSARREYPIAGQRRARPDPNVLTQPQAAKCCAVSITTIQRLVASGLLNNGQVVPRAPSEIRRSDLGSEPVRRAREGLRETGRLRIVRDGSVVQSRLCERNQGWRRPGIMNEVAMGGGLQTAVGRRA
jgi:hypothetical protein